MYSLDILLSQFWTSPLFQVRFYLLLLTCIQVSQEAGIPSLQEFPILFLYLIIYSLSYLLACFYYESLEH